jgi:hypothetical protein
MRSTVSERRDTARVPIRLDVMLNPDTHGFQLFHTRDISLDGVFVETSARFAKKAVADLAIKLSAGNASRVYRLRATVARVTPDGVAFVFDDLDSDTYEALLQLVFAQQPKGAF